MLLLHVNGQKSPTNRRNDLHTNYFFNASFCWQSLALDALGYTCISFYFATTFVTTILVEELVLYHFNSFIQYVAGLGVLFHEHIDVVYWLLCIREKIVKYTRVIAARKLVILSVLQIVYELILLWLQRFYKFLFPILAVWMIMFVIFRTIFCVIAIKSLVIFYITTRALTIVVYQLCATIIVVPNQSHRNPVLAMRIFMASVQYPT